MALKQFSAFKFRYASFKPVISIHSFNIIRSYSQLTVSQEKKTHFIQDKSFNGFKLEQSISSNNSNSMFSLDISVHSLKHSTTKNDFVQLLCLFQSTILDFFQHVNFKCISTEHQAFPSTSMKSKSCVYVGIFKEKDLRYNIVRLFHHLCICNLKCE